MKDFIKKFTGLRGTEEAKEVQVPEPQSFRGVQQVNQNFSLGEKKMNGVAKTTEPTLLVGFFKAAHEAWAPFFMDEAEYNAHKTYSTNGSHIRSRRGNSAAQTMPHPFMYGVVVHLLNAFVDGSVNDLKRITQDYRAGVAKFDFSSGHPVIMGASQSHKEEQARPQQQAAPVIKPVQEATPIEPVAVNHPVETAPVEQVTVQPAPISVAPAVVEPVYAPAPETVAPIVQEAAPVTVTTLAELLPGIDDVGPANCNPKPENKSKFTPVALPYNGGLSEALARAEESLDNLPHISSSAGGLIHYASSSNRVN